MDIYCPQLTYPGSYIEHPDFDKPDFDKKEAWTIPYGSGGVRKLIRQRSHFIGFIGNC